MSEERINREDFDALWGAYLVFARQLRERDRHGRGGTTFGEMLENDAFAEAWIQVLTDPARISKQVDDHLNWWLGERDVWGAHQSQFLIDFHHPPGVAVLGKTSRHGEQFPGPEEVGRRAARGGEYDGGQSRAPNQKPRRARGTLPRPRRSLRGSLGERGRDSPSSVGVPTSTNA